MTNKTATCRVNPQFPMGFGEPLVDNFVGGGGNATAAQLVQGGLFVNGEWS